MALKIDNHKRVFIIEKGGKKINLPDPGSKMSAQEVRKFYAGKHPELTNATVKGPVINGNNAVYTFETTVGTLG